MTTNLRVFVYGTLKQGEANFDRFCRGHVLQVDPAVCVGNIYGYLSRHFPYVRIPRSSILANGSGDFAADLAAQDAVDEVAMRAALRQATSQDGFGIVYGQVLTFDAPDAMGRLDRLEGFRPNWRGGSHYLRSLVAVTLTTKHRAVDMLSCHPLAAWIYHVDDPMGMPLLADGEWTGNLHVIG